MLFTTGDIADELAAQLNKTDLGVTEARSHEGAAFDELHEVVFKLDNGQEFLLTVTRWGGPRA